VDPVVLAFRIKRESRHSDLTFSQTAARKRSRSGSETNAEHPSSVAGEVGVEARKILAVPVR
jgi:hypothetical protein